MIATIPLNRSKITFELLHIINHHSVALRQQEGKKDITGFAFGVGGGIKGHEKV